MKEILKKIYNIFDKQKFAATGVVILIILLNISITLALISHSNKDLDKYVVGIETKLDKNMFKVMLEDSSGGYTESVDNTFPSYDYFFNPTKSGCIDAEGNKLDNSLVFDINTRKVSINVSKISYCYLYFDMVKEVPSNPNLAQKLITDGNMWQSGLEGDGYRFTGSGNAESSTTPDNFICFGTTDQTECKNNETKYLYRIIGVFEDGEGNEHVKLIKYTPLENLYQWNNANDNTSWNNSSLKAGLNSSYYLTNTVYDYMQNERWSNRIVNWTWNAVDTKTNSSSGPDYTLISTQNIYLHEMNRTNKISTIGEWTTAQAKIGLMYASDYQMSLGLSSLSYTGAENTATLKTGWLHQSNNYVSKDEIEWTISKYSGSSYWNNWSLYSSGILNGSSIVQMHKLRVAFYLIPEILYFNGTGDYLDPIIIGEENRISATNDGANVTATITPGEYELHKYCINTSQTNLSSCEWKDASTNITDTLSESGDYYLHVVDKGGYVMHSDKMTYIAYEQLKNYTMLYDEGDECTDITGGWSLGSYTRGGYSTSAAVKNQTNIYANTTSIYSENLQGTNNPINLTSYNKLYIYGLVERATQNLPIGAHLTEVKYFSMSYFYQSANLSFPQIAGYKGFASVDVNSTKSYYLIVGSWDNRGSGYFYNIWLTKPDNWQSICTKAGITTPSDITTLLDDTTSLTTIFSNRDAVEYMAKQCTGDFMASAVSSTTFKTALEASPYKNIIKDNVHWAKFLAMAS